MENARDLHLPSHHLPARILAVRAGAGAEVQRDTVLLAYETPVQVHELGPDGRRAARDEWQFHELRCSGEGRIVDVKVRAGDVVEDKKCVPRATDDQRLTRTKARGDGYSGAVRSRRAAQRHVCAVRQGHDKASPPRLASTATADPAQSRLFRPRRYGEGNNSDRAQHAGAHRLGSRGATPRSQRCRPSAQGPQAYSRVGLGPDCHPRDRGSYSRRVDGGSHESQQRGAQGARVGLSIQSPWFNC